MTTKTSTQIQTEIDAAIAERDAINKHLKALRADLATAKEAEAAAEAEALGRALIKASAAGPEALAAFLKERGIEAPTPPESNTVETAEPGGYDRAYGSHVTAEGGDFE